MKKKNQSNYRAKVVRMQSNFEEVSLQAQNAALVWICKRYAGRRHQAKIPRVKGSFNLEEAGWNKLIYRYAGFFIFLGFLNEFVWRNYPEWIWVNFKVWGILPITLMFTIFQLPLIKKYKNE